MRTKNVAIRTIESNGFWKEVEMPVDPKNPTCKFCGEKLWISPSNSPYCNNWDADHDEATH